MEYLSLKLCPVCGEVPEKVTEELGRPGGHGYPGHKSFQYRCECCKLVRGTEVTDIYESTEQAMHRAKVEWNAEVERIQNHLRKQWVPKVSVENEVI